MQFIDTHCHIHDSELTKKYDQTADEILADAKKKGITQVICVGTNNKSSIEAVTFAAVRESVYASIALHPHEAAKLTDEQCREAVHELEVLLQTANKPVVAIGECGLDYYYHESIEVKDRQKLLLRMHLELAVKYELPVIFHIRDAFEDFFEILKDFPSIAGVVHSFSAGIEEMQGVIKVGLYVGLNGIMTFSKETFQTKAAKNVPLDKLVLETDAPFLTPKPFRGKMCKPEHIRVTAEFLAKLRDETLEELASRTTANAKNLFGV